MVREVKWTKYLWLSLLSFGAFMLELLSIFGIEVIFLHVDIQPEIHIMDTQNLLKSKGRTTVFIEK